MKKAIVLFLVFILLFVVVLLANAWGFWGKQKEKFMLYTSMKESLMGGIRDAFVKKNPDITFDYYSAGAGKIMAKIAAERQAGSIAADVIWTSEVPDFYQMKKEGILTPYISPNAKYVQSPVKDTDGYFTPIRLGTLGFTYNTVKVENPPKSWNDLLDSRFKGGFGIANPALSGTACVSVAMIVNNLGWDYIKKLKENGAIMGQGSGQVVDDTASGDLMVCMGVDFITVDKIQKGANVGLSYPQEMLVIPSPMAIFKGAKNLKTAQKFIDFMLSKEGQTLIANSGTLPIRDDVPILEGFGLIHPSEAIKRAMKIDYEKMIAEKESIIKEFSSIMRAK